MPWYILGLSITLENRLINYCKQKIFEIKTRTKPKCLYHFALIELQFIVGQGYDELAIQILITKTQLITKDLCQTAKPFTRGVKTRNCWQKSAENLAVSSTSKSFSEASTNPQYDKRLFIELQVQYYMKIASSERSQNMLCAQTVFCFCFDIQNNLCTQHVLRAF